MRLPLLVILGPTATGKSALGVDLALALEGEIISGDSMQVYQGLDIGTAKITPAERKNVPHHLLDIRKPDESFSVAEFQSLAAEKIEEIASRGRLPILVGGTGLYIQSVIDDYRFTAQKDSSAYREELFQLAAEKGNAWLHALLSEVDAPAAARIHVHDLKRITRALEYYRLTGLRISDNKGAVDPAGSGKYQALLVGLTMNRPELYARIDARVDQMLEGGLLEEARSLLEKGYHPLSPALQGLGYRQMIAHLKNELGYAEAVELLKRDTRRFAKRQQTWFRRDARIHWFEIDKYTDYQILLDEIISLTGRTIRNNVE
ncbi:MAG: tRNA (adenosine(37)-N6)-dimethylallyltransferase MiaA [Clostridia bacterium]|nr:tRNA (adenosine(37)-N6)-dimethylallyltransferase MiaA [Clostridia bacterium]